MREQPYDGLSLFGKSEISQRRPAAALCRGGVAHAPEDTPVLPDAQMERRALSELSTLSSSPVQTNAGTEGDEIVSSSPESREACRRVSAHAISCLRFMSRKHSMV